jgi:hypothetical protein
VGVIGGNEREEKKNKQLLVVGASIQSWQVDRIFLLY